VQYGWGGVSGRLEYVVYIMGGRLSSDKYIPGCAGCSSV